MPVATLTTKGRITMPKVVRNALCLRSGDRVAFVLHGRSEALLKPITKSVDEVFGRLHDPAQPSKTVTEMKAAVATRFWRRH